MINADHSRHGDGLSSTLSKQSPPAIRFPKRAYTHSPHHPFPSRSGAEWYENEADCGRAIKDFINESGVPREEIWFTTKLSATFARPFAPNPYRANTLPGHAVCTTSRARS